MSKTKNFRNTFGNGNMSINGNGKGRDHILARLSGKGVKRPVGNFINKEQWNTKMGSYPDTADGMDVAQAVVSGKGQNKPRSKKYYGADDWASALASLGLNQSQWDAMSPEQQAAITAQQSQPTAEQAAASLASEAPTSDGSTPVSESPAETYINAPVDQSQPDQSAIDAAAQWAQEQWDAAQQVLANESANQTMPEPTQEQATASLQAETPAPTPTSSFDPAAPDQSAIDSAAQWAQQQWDAAQALLANESANQQAAQPTEQQALSSLVQEGEKYVASNPSPDENSTGILAGLKSTLAEMTTTEETTPTGTQNTTINITNPPATQPSVAIVSPGSSPIGTSSMVSSGFMDTINSGINSILPKTKAGSGGGGGGSSSSAKPGTSAAKVPFYKNKWVLLIGGAALIGAGIYFWPKLKKTAIVKPIVNA